MESLDTRTPLFTGEVLTSSVGNVAFLLGFQRLKPEQQVDTIVGDACALVERIH